MRMRFWRLSAVLLLAVVLVFSLIIPAAAAQTETYRFDEFEMSLKLPKDYYVITRDTPEGDEVFEALGFDYNQTMTAMTTDNYYLFAYDEDNTFQISLKITQDEDTKRINNYSDITAAERMTNIENVKKGEGVTSAAEVKHNGSIYIDSAFTKEDEGETVYFKRSDTIINGYQIYLEMRKEGEPISDEEAKVLTNAANSLKFDKINRNTGAVFSWWRLLLWIGLLAVVAIAVTILYKRRQAANARRMEERRKRHESTYMPEEHQPAHAQSEEMTFEESLGYRDDEEFAARADADEMATFDINVRERDPAKGISFFEDEGSGIDDGSDYFDTYFNEPVEKRAWYRRLFSAVGTYLKMALKHTGYFFKNLFLKLTRGVKKLLRRIKK